MNEWNLGNQVDASGYKTALASQFPELFNAKCRSIRQVTAIGELARSSGRITSCVLHLNHCDPSVSQGLMSDFQDLPGNSFCRQ